MKLVTFEVSTVLGKFQRLGAILDDYILDLNAAYTWWLEVHEKKAAAKRLANAIVPPTMREFIEGGENSMAEAKTLLAFVQETWNLQEASRYKGTQGECMLFARSNVELLTPLPNPNSLRDFISFEAHVKKGYERRQKEMPKEWYKYPIFYKGNHRSLLGPDEPLVWPRYTQKLDYELELACIIGKQGRDVSESDADSYIFGFAVLNDFSARDIQMEEMKCRLGPAKGKDFGTAIGPYIVTADEVPDPRNLKMTAWVNDEIWSEGNAGTSHWTWAQIIAHLSNEETIYPTDILGSGTVGGGCGYELDRWIQPGDTVTLEIDGLGILRNQIITHEQADRNSHKAESTVHAPSR